MDDLLHNTPDVTVAFRKVKGAELRRRLVVVGVRLELQRTQRAVPLLAKSYARWRASASGLG